MKLWHVTQWGNEEEGVNGWDTQCVVAAVDLESAVKAAELYFKYHSRNPDKAYRDGASDAVYLLGDDGKPDGEPRLVIRIWISFADNLGHYPSWHWHEGKWVDSETLYGPDN